jgi:hypothetical protein
MEANGMYGAVAFRKLGNGRAVWIYPMMYTFKLCIGPLGTPWYDDGWCYKDLSSAQKAFKTWKPELEREPSGWVRHPPTGRRRFPDGNPEFEETRE